MLKMKQLAALAIVASCIIISPAKAGDYDDWWLCANNCAEEDAACIDACTDEYNSTHYNPYPADLCIQVLTDNGFLTTKQGLEKASRDKGLKIRHDTKGGPICEGELGLVPRCPAGSVASTFEMPIYDESGLFVVCYEKVWICIPEGLEPAG